MMMDEFEVRSYGWQELAAFTVRFDAGIGRETVVQMDGDKPGAKDRATG